MAKIKLNLSRLPLPEKIAKAKQIVTAMDGNANFPTPVPPLATLTTAINEAEAAFTAAQAARQDAKTKTTTQTLKEDALDRLLTQEAAYVEAAAGDDPAKIQSAGMDTKAPPTSTSMPGQPQGLTPTEGDHEGEVDVSWDTVPEAKSYVLEKSLDPPTPTSWNHAGVSTRSSFTIAGLTSGTRYWFRVAAVGRIGQSGWSDPATKIVP